MHVVTVDRRQASQAARLRVEDYAASLPSTTGWLKRMRSRQHGQRMVQGAFFESDLHSVRRCYEHAIVAFRCAVQGPALPEHASRTCAQTKTLDPTLPSDGRERTSLFPMSSSVGKPTAVPCALTTRHRAGRVSLSASKVGVSA